RSFCGPHRRHDRPRDRNLLPPTTMLVCGTSTRVVVFVVAAVAALAPRKLYQGGAFCSSFAPRTGLRPRSTTWSCSVLRSSNGPGGEEDGADSTGSGAAEDPDNLLGGQALQALEFWKNRAPSPVLPPTQVIGLLMAALQRNDDPAENDGLRTVFEFSSGMCRRAVGGTAESFIKEARYSVFGATVGCQSFALEPMSMVGDRLATQVRIICSGPRRESRCLVSTLRL
ncbi:unnamed protein product, partial [Ectocarpus sp. 12 AP-2014]